MVKIDFRTNFLIVFFALGLFEVGKIQAESSVARISSQKSRAFNPFSVSSWFSIPSQFMQYWFPLFQSAYRPPYLQKPSTPKPTTPKPTTTRPPPVENQDKSEKTDNIFGISGPPGDSVECLPSASEIEWNLSLDLTKGILFTGEWLRGEDRMGLTVKGSVIALEALLPLLYYTTTLPGAVQCNYATAWNSAAVVLSDYTS